MIKYTKNGITTEKTTKEMFTILKRYCKIRQIEKRQAYMDNVNKRWNEVHKMFT